MGWRWNNVRSKGKRDSQEKWVHSPCLPSILTPKLDGARMGPNRREISRKRQPGPPRLAGQLGITDRQTGTQQTCSGGNWMEGHTRLAWLLPGLAIASTRQCPVRCGFLPVLEIHSMKFVTFAPLIRRASSGFVCPTSPEVAGLLGELGSYHCAIRPFTTRLRYRVAP